MRSNFLATEVAKKHEVDLLALNQRKLLTSYYGSNAEGLKAAGEALGKAFSEIEFFEFSGSGGESEKRLLALKSLVSRVPYSVAWLRSDELASAISRCMQAKQYDVVHFDTVGLAQFRHLVNGVPTVLDHHNVESHMMIRRAEKEPNLLKKLYFYQEGVRLKHYEKRVVTSFDGHITCSEVDSARLLELSSCLDVKAIPNSIRMDGAFSPSLSSEAGSRLLFIGGLDWYPNHDAVLHFLKRVWPKVLAEDDSAEFNLVGKNPSDEILAYARDDSRIKVHGFVDDINSLYAEADVFVCPIRDGGGTKLKVLDAMAHHLPVVGYPEAWEGIDVVDGQSGMICKSSDEFASGILSLLADKERAREMGQGGRNLVQSKYEAQRVGEALANYYVDIARKS